MAHIIKKAFFEDNTIVGQRKMVWQHKDKMRDFYNKRQYQEDEKR